MKKELSVNWLFYTFTFLVLVLFNLFLSYNSQLPFLLKVYAFGYGSLQSLLEIFLILGIGSWIHKKFPIGIYYFYIGLTFIFLLIHMVNTILVRMVDSHFDYAWNIFFSGSIQHFISSIRSLDVNLFLVGVVFSAFILVPLLGICFYYLMKKRKKSFSLKRYFSLLFSITILLLVLDLITFQNFSSKQIRRFQKVLPFAKKLFTPSGPLIILTRKIKPPLNEKVLSDQLSNLTLTQTPNLYLFVVEAFRSDHINEKITPNLALLNQENISQNAYSSANSTHQSWYSIFHSNYPIYWRETKKDWKMGSLPLRALKNAGYKIRVYASTDLKYFNMDQLLFGKKPHLLDAYHDFSLNTSITPAQRDRLAIEQLQKDIQMYREKTIFITFIDSTHSNYNWTDDFPIEFQPIADPINYLEVSTFRNSLEGIKNRYKNACKFVDSLVGGVIDVLKKENLFDSSLFCLTGDHGEEFFEDGALFHGTHLNRVQTNIPIIYKLPKSSQFPRVKLSGHVDIFPTFLHYLTGQKYSWMQGQSILSSDYTPCILTAAHNGNNTPYVFSFFNGNIKLIAKFKDSNSVFQDTVLEIVSIEDEFGSPIRYPNKKLSQRMQKEFSGIFDRLGTSLNLDAHK